MKVAIVGGIYGKSPEYRKGLSITPETTLEDGLRRRGIDVSTFSHYASIDYSLFDLVHVHHLSWGAIRAATDGSQCAFVFTTHNAQYMSRSLPLHYQWALRFVVRRADAVVALSSTEKTWQERNYQLNGGISRIIPNGIPVDIYKMQRTNSKGMGEPWQILFVGQLNEIKRVDSLLKAVSQIPFPVSVNLVYQNSQLESNLRLLALRLGIGQAVHFLGPRNPEELCRLYNQADLFILPSSGEVLPSVITEAMLCGTPIIATDVGGVVEQLGGFGTVVSPNNTEELVSAIINTINHYDQYEGQALQMSEYARRTFTIDSMLDQHVDLYRQVSEPVPRRRSDALLRPGSLFARFGLKVWPRVHASSPSVA